MISIQNLTKTYQNKQLEETVAIQNLSLDLPRQGLVVICGRSGCGKTTLINCLAGIEKINSGDILVDGKSLSQMSWGELDNYRNHFVGIVFQDYNLIENLTVGQNIELSLTLQGKKVSDEQVLQVLDRVELEKQSTKQTNALSGGQKQRVAIARTLIKDSQLLIADEPTGNLDETTAEQIWKLLQNQSKTRLVLVVTHDNDFAKKYGDRIITLKNGELVDDIDNTDNNIHPQPHQIKESKQKQTASNTSGETTSVASTPNPTQTNTTDTTVDTHTLNPNNNQTTPAKPKNLPLGYSIRLGSKILLQKKLRLIFTIILPLFGFVVFGFFFSAIRFNGTKARLEYWQERGTKSIVVYGAENEENASHNSVKNIINLDQIKNQTNAYGILDLRDYTVRFSRNFASNFDNLFASDLLNEGGNRFSILIDDQTTQQDLGISLIDGHLPTNDSEIVISDLTLEAIQRFGYYDKYADEPQLKTLTNGFEELKEITFGLADDYDITKNINKAVNAPDFQIKVVGIFSSGITFTELYNEDYTRKESGLYDTYNPYNTLSTVSILHQDFFTNYASQYDKVEYNTNQLGRAFVKLTNNLQQNTRILKGYQVSTLLDSLYDRVEEFSSTTAPLFSSMSIIFVAFSSLLITNFISASLHTNKKMIGILRSMGARNRDIFAIFASESFIIASILAVLAFILIFPLVLSMSAYLPTILFSTDIVLFLILFGISLGTSALAVALPILRQIKTPIVDIIKK